MNDSAKISIDGNVIYVTHPGDPSREKGEKLNRDLFEILKTFDTSKPFFICNDFTNSKIGLDKEIKEYKETGVDFFNSIKSLPSITIFIITNPVIRVMAGTVAILTGQKIHFVKNMEEAKSLIKSKG